MAIAHSDHMGKYQADGYAYQSTDLSNDYIVRNAKLTNGPMLTQYACNSI